MSTIKTSCAPNKFDAENNTCFTLEQLREMARAYNRYITKQAFAPAEKEGPTAPATGQELIVVKEGASKSYLLRELRKRFADVCGDGGDRDICITQQKFMQKVVGEMRSKIFCIILSGQKDLN